MTQSAQPAKPNPPEPPPQRPMPSPTSNLLGRVFGGARKLWFGVAALVGIAYVAFDHFGPYWPTEPTISPGTGASPESSPASPFVVKNDSVVFPIRQAVFTCFLDGALFKRGDEKGWMMVFVGPSKIHEWWIKSDTPVDIDHDHPVNYFCDPYEMVRDVHLNYEPARLRGFQVTIAVDYEIDLPKYTWLGHIESGPFTCDVAENRCLWTIGKLVH